MVGGGEVVGDRLGDLAEPGVADLLATIFPVDGSQMWVTRPGVFSRGLLRAWWAGFGPRVGHLAWQLAEHGRNLVQRVGQGLSEGAKA